MKEQVKVIRSSEVAHQLRQKLGAARDWEDLLSDMRRERSSYHGITLLPFGNLHDGKMARPYYLVTDMEKFIEAAIAADPTVVTLKPIQFRVVEVDRDDKTWWKLKSLRAVA